MSEARPEYATLARDLAWIAADFGVALDGAAQARVVGLAVCFEAIDRHLDETGEDAARARLSESLVRGVGGRGDAPLPAPVEPHAAWLRDALGAERPAFARALSRFFACTEALRRSTRAEEFVRCVREEARCAAEMIVAIAAPLGAPRFARFLGRLAVVANLVDKLKDVRGDAARGEVRIAPGPWLHLRMLAELALRAPALVLFAPRPVRLAWWGARHMLPTSDA